MYHSSVDPKLFGARISRYLPSPARSRIPRSTLASASSVALGSDKYRVASSGAKPPPR
jgi:hypothetical protein